MVQPFGKKTTEDFWMQSHPTWFSLYNAGDSEVVILLGIDRKGEDFDRWLLLHRTQPDLLTINVDGETYRGVAIYVPPGATYESPSIKDNLSWGRVITNGNQVYFSSLIG